MSYNFFKQLFIIGLLIANMQSCKKDQPPIYKNNFVNVFDIYWSNMSKNYVYWDIDTTAWDIVYIKYRPLFANLDINNQQDILTGYKYFKEITKNLTDSHYQLNFFVKPIIDSVINPALTRKKNNSKYRNPISFYNIDLKYLDPGFVSGYDNFSAPNQSPLFALSGTINGRTLYFTCNKFTVYQSFISSKKNDVQPVINYFLEKLKYVGNGINSIIIDVRNNSGGDIADLNFLLGHMIDKRLNFGYTRYKSGSDRLNFTPWVQAFINPQKDSKGVTVPIVVLADSFSQSISELFAMAVHTLPNGKVIGEDTFGATGPITDYDIYNDGQFTIGNIMSVYTSSAEFKYIDGKYYESKGFPPDIFVPFDYNYLTIGKDFQLERCIALLQ